MDEIIRKILGKGKFILLDRLSKTDSKLLRRLYWNLRAQDIHDTWGEGTEDFHVIRRVIDRVGAKKLLDIGCGSGRCFPLYQQMHITEVVGQDISSSALALCEKRFPGLPYHLFHGGIEKLNYPDSYFDLIISTRVLAAVLPDDIAATVKTLSRLGNSLYLNEMTDSDYVGPSTYWFKHDYKHLMAENGFSVIEHGNIGKQTWVLYRKEKNA
ncbi:MAG: class I SAM-dependent methyltransferase [bacterium]